MDILKRNWLMPKITLVSLVLLSFIACGGGDDDDNQQPQVPGNVNGGQVINSGGGGLLASGFYAIQNIKETVRTSSGSVYSSDIFSNPIYSVDGWFAKTVLKSYNSNIGNYSYSYSFPNSFSGKTPNSEISCTYDNYRSHITKVTIGRENMNFEYDNKNRLTSVTVYYGSSLEATDKYTYDDKYNVIRFQRINGSNILIDTKFEYTQISAKGIPLQCFSSATSSLGVLFNQNLFPFLEIGAFGNSIPMYLISKVVESDGTERLFDYVTDNGWVVNMTEKVYMTSGTYIYSYDISWDAKSRASYTNWLFSDEGSPYYRYLK